MCMSSRRNVLYETKETRDVLFGQTSSTSNFEDINSTKLFNICFPNEKSTFLVSLIDKNVFAGIGKLILKKHTKRKEQEEEKNS